MAGECAVIVRVQAQSEQLHTLRSLVREKAAQVGFSPGCVDDIVLAVNEACMNVIQHGYKYSAGILELSVCAERDAIEFRIGDDAPTVSMSAWRPREFDDLRPGGLGVHFIRQIMDEISYLPSINGQGNLLSLKKYLTSPETVS